jgi:2-octaprenylphenol hydroxylase
VTIGPQPRCDVVIVGAGPVGLAVAALLKAGAAAAQLRVRIVDAQPAPEWRAASMDPRVYALSRASQRVFERLGLWEAIRGRRASPYRRMRVWEGTTIDTAAAIKFDCAEIGEPDLGHIVEDSLLRERLTHWLMAEDRAELTFATGLATATPGTSGVRLTLTSGEALTATVVIAADGGASRVRALTAMPVIERNYGQQAIVTHVATAAPHDETAWQRFLPSGPLAFLPLVDGRSSVVWSLPSARASALLACDDAQFLAALSEASGGMLGALGPMSPRAAFPLQKLHAVEYCRPGVALVGDAAHCVHPLAGQGMNLGLLDAACLAATLTAATLRGEHLGDERVLGRYARERKGENLAMLLAFDALDRLFRLPAWAVPLRKLGLAAVDRARPAKRLLMRRALGLAAGGRREQTGSTRGQSQRSTHRMRRHEAP